MIACQREKQNILMNTLLLYNFYCVIFILSNYKIDLHKNLRFDVLVCYGLQINGYTIISSSVADRSDLHYFPAPGHAMVQIPDHIDLVEKAGTVLGWWDYHTIRAMYNEKEHVVIQKFSGDHRTNIEIEPAQGIAMGVYSNLPAPQGFRRRSASPPNRGTLKPIV